MENLEFIGKLCNTIKSIVGKDKVKNLSYESENYEILINERIVITLYEKFSKTIVRLRSINSEDHFILFPSDREECLRIIKLQIKYINDHFDDLLTTLELINEYTDRFLNEVEKKFLSSTTLLPSSNKEGIFTTRIVRYDPINMLFMNAGDSMSTHIDIIHDGTAKGYCVTAQATWNISIYNREPDWIDKFRDVFSDVRFEDNYIIFCDRYHDRMPLSTALGCEVGDFFRVSLGWSFIYRVLGRNSY